MESAVLFAGSLPGSILMTLGHTLVLVCVCFDMARVLSVPRSHRRYVASTIFMTLALPSILILAVSVLIHAASGAWQDVASGVFSDGCRDLPLAPGHRRGQLVEGQGQGPGALAPQAVGVSVPEWSGHRLTAGLPRGDSPPAP